MERFIIEYTVGDGYTWSAEFKQPIIYSSKQDILDDLELIILEHFDNYIQQQQIMLKLEEKRNVILKELQALKDKNKPDTDKIEAKYKEFMNMAQKMKEQRESFSEEFDFGGATFSYSDFYYKDDSGKMHVYMPTVYTLDELFAPVEAKLQEQKSYVKIIKP